MTECLFCRVASGEIEADLVAEEDRWIAFRDINPQAPTHVLVVPRKHIATLNELESEDRSLVGEMIHAATEIARRERLSESGYRLVFNTNEGGGQSVFHIHLHVLGGRRMTWPPG